MNRFTVDTNIFSIMFNNFSFSVWVEFWDSIQLMINNGILFSTEESYFELMNLYNKDEEIGKWINRNKSIFHKPTNEECQIVCDIYINKKFREGVKERSIRNGSPEADAFLVAKAKSSCSILVTNESDQKDNSEKIPMICTSQSVPYMKRVDFYNYVRNYKKNSNLTCVIYNELRIPNKIYID